MSLTATASSIPGTLRQEILIDGRHRLTTDVPERLGGEGTAPAPHELFPAALAAMRRDDANDLCAHQGLGHSARSPLTSTTTITRRRADSRSTIRLAGDLTHAQLERLEKVAAACPLRRSIEVGIEFVETPEPP